MEVVPGYIFLFLLVKLDPADAESPLTLRNL